MKRKFSLCLGVAFILLMAALLLGLLFVIFSKAESKSEYPASHTTRVVGASEAYATNISTNIIQIKSYCIISNQTDLADGMKRANESSKVDLEKKRNDSLRALFAINHVNWVVTKIKNYNDPSVLEEEYKNICADALDLNAIKDQEIIELICDIMDVITDMRIEEKEREMLKEELDQGMSDAMFDSIASGLGGGVGARDPVTAVFGALTSAATAAINYKRAKKKMMTAYGKKTWSLDKNRMRYLNELNKSLLQKYWAIVQRYDLPDEYRVTEADVALLIEHLKDDDSARRHAFLKSLANKYSGLQNYWYYRGLSAYENKDYEDAHYALELYHKTREEYGTILRVDSIAAKAAMLQIQMMIREKNNNAEAYCELLKTIEKNTLIDEWQVLYFCAAVYINHCKNLGEAERVLGPLITHLEFQRNRRWIDWQEIVADKRDFGTTNKVDRLVAGGDALFDCRRLLADASEAVDQEKYRARLDEICNGAQASARDKLFCYFSMGYLQVLERLVPDIKNIRVLRDGGRFKTSLPMSWVISREGESRLSVGKVESFSAEAFDLSQFKTLSETNERTIEVRSDGTVCALVDYGSPKDIDSNEVRKIVYTIRYNRGSEVMKDQGLMLAVEFESSPKSKVLAPTKAHLGRWHLGSGLTDKSRWAYKGNSTEPDCRSVEL